METKKEDYLSPSIDFLWLEACSLLTSWSAELIDGMDEGDPDTFHGIEYKEYE